MKTPEQIMSETFDLARSMGEDAGRAEERHRILTVLLEEVDRLSKAGKAAEALALNDVYCRLAFPTATRAA